MNEYHDLDYENNPWDPRCESNFYAVHKIGSPTMVFFRYEDAKDYLGEERGIIHKTNTEVCYLSLESVDKT
jgi:hypothetical protein